MPSLFGISIEREAGDAGETFWLVNNAPTEPIKYRFIENSKSLARFQEMMSVDDLAVSGPFLVFSSRYCAQLDGG
jgi:hypothetical protein